MGQTSRYGSADLYSYPFYRQFQQKQQVFSEVATLFSYNPAVHRTIDRRDQMQPIAADLVSGTFFSTLGVEPEIGGTTFDIVGVASLESLSVIRPTYGLPCR